MYINYRKVCTKMSNLKFGRSEAAVVYRSFLNNSFDKSDVLSGLKKYSSSVFKKVVAHVDTTTDNVSDVETNWKMIRGVSRDDNEANVLFNVDRIRSNSETLIVKNDFNNFETREYQPLSSNMEQVISRAKAWDNQGRVASNPSSLVISNVTLGMTGPAGSKDVVGRMHVHENDLAIVPSARSVLQHMYIVKEPVLRDIAEKNGSDMQKYDARLSDYTNGNNASGAHFSQVMTQDLESEPVIKAPVYNRGLKNQTIDFGHLEKSEDTYRIADVSAVNSIDTVISQSVRKMSKDVQLQRASSISAEV